MQREKKYEKPLQDGRRKIDPALHNEIIEKKKTMTSPQLAREYGVSVSLIKLIVYPQRQKAMRERNKLKWKEYSLHYGKKYHAEAIKKYRAKKRKLKMTFNPSPVRPTKKICSVCGKIFVGHKQQKYCNPKHRYEVYRQKMAF
jgi:hypothetical protein